MYDEPTGALDYLTGVIVLEAIERINCEFGTTTVVIAHNAAIAGMEDCVVRLADGMVAVITTMASRGQPTRAYRRLSTWKGRGGGVPYHRCGAHSPRRFGLDRGPGR
jgi:ABC-type transport system involved in cytochrome bd biosynthesis fused ATPase/permease subunit